MEKPKFCPNCGKDTSQSATFCSNCGHQLSKKARKAESTTDLATPAHQADRPTTKSEPGDHSATAKFNFAKVFAIWTGVSTIALFLIFLAAGSAEDGGAGELFLGSLIIGLLISVIGVVIQRSVYLRKHPALKADENDQEVDEKLKGVGGWLAWFTFGLIITTVLVLVALFGDFSNYSTFADAGYSGIIDFEILANIALLVLSAWGAILIFKRKKLAIKVVTVFLAASAVFGLIDAGLASSIHTDQGTSSSSDTSSTSSDTSRAVLGALIWIPYFQRSRRVKATLVE